MSGALSILLASVGAGFGGEVMRRYAGWRRRRLTLASEIRNGPLINDRSVRLIHVGLMTVLALVVAWILFFILLFTGVVPISYSPL